MGDDPRVRVCAANFCHGLDVFIKAHVGVDMPVEWSVWTDLIIDAFIVYAHLGVSETVVDLGVEFVVGADLRVDVAVVMKVEVIEGDPAVEGVAEWKI